MPTFCIYLKGGATIDVIATDIEFPSDKPTLLINGAKTHSVATLRLLTSEVAAVMDVTEERERARNSKIAGAIQKR